MAWRVVVATGAAAIGLGGVGAFAQDVPATGETPAPAAEIGGPPAEQKGYTFVPRAAVRETLTDNALGTAHDRSADLINTVQPGFRLSGEGGRTKLTADYNFSYDKYIHNSSQDGARHDLLGTGTAELMREFLFIDGAASISQELVDRTGAITATDRNNNNLTQTEVFRISPYIRNNFGNFATSEVRYAFGATSSGSNLGDSTRNEFTAGLKSGPDFTRLLWGVDLSYFSTDRSTSTTSTTTIGGTSSSNTEQTADLNLQYVLDREWSLLGSIGYQRIEDNSFANPPHGPTASVGFEFTPGPRTKIRILGNHRNDDNYFSLQGSYEFPGGTLFTASYDEGITTGQDTLLNNVSALSTDSQGNFIDSRTQGAFQPRGSSLGLNNLSNGSARRKTGTASLVGSVGLSTVSGLARHEELSTDTGVGDETSDGFTITYSRELGLFTSVTTSIDYTHSDITGTTAEKDDTYRVSVGLTRQLTATVDASLFGTSLLRFSNVDGRGIRENAAILTLRKTF